MGSKQSTSVWPDSRDFAFTIFDDPDGQSLHTSKLVYSFLTDLGFRTTKAVWPLEARRERNSGGETCSNPEYLHFLLSLQERGFEIAFHNAAPHSAFREETIEALDRFTRYFGDPPFSMSNHYNEEAIYWGAFRFTGWRRSLYNLFTFGRKPRKFWGHIEGHPMFWGDVCRDRIQYCRNFIYSDINTLRICPWMPYSDPLLPWVRYWFAASEGHNAVTFLRTVSDVNQDRLEKEHGASIIYTHFGHGYVSNGQLNPDFRRAMQRLARKNGWFVPVSALLTFLMKRDTSSALNATQRRVLETRWLWDHMNYGINAVKNSRAAQLKGSEMSRRGLLAG